MGKRNQNVDFITDLQERANHNINPHYWFNRVTPFTMAQWKANAYFAPLFFVIYSSIGVLWLIALNENAVQESKTFWQFILDFSDSFTSARFVGLVLFSIYWVIAGLTTFQAVMQRIRALSAVQPRRNKEKKKKYPRRPKNYR